MWCWRIVGWCAGVTVAHDLGVLCDGLTDSDGRVDAERAPAGVVVTGLLGLIAAADDPQHRHRDGQRDVPGECGPWHGGGQPAPGYLVDHDPESLSDGDPGACHEAVGSGVAVCSGYLGLG